MDTDTAHSSSADSDRLHLTNIVVIAALVIFVTLVVAFTGSLTTLWPVYLVPIVIAALAYEVPGAVFVTTLCVGIVTLLLPGAQVSSGSRLGILAGFVTFLASGVVVGLQANRSHRHSRELEHASVNDPETGLLKPSALRARLAEEIDRGGRHGVEVSLVIARIDDLDAFKSTFGAYKTGLLLEHMADIVRIAVRATDVVGRYSHDAFAIVAPFAGPEQAQLIAQRVRDAVSDASFEGDVLQPAARSSVTVSHASAPREATALDALADLVEQRIIASATSSVEVASNMQLHVVADSGARS